MKKLFIIILIISSLYNCTPELIRKQNPYIPITNVSFTAYLNLPSYHTLNYVNNGFLTNSQGYNGILIFNTGYEFVAYEATCSNHEVTSKSSLELNGSLADCKECGRSYSLLNGQPTKYDNPSPYLLVPYRVELNQNVLYISNW